MKVGKNFFLKFYLVIFLLLAIIFLFYLGINKFKKNISITAEPIKVNLISSSHKNLPWKFKSSESVIFVKPGDVTTIEYTVENLSNEETTGVATFAYFPNHFGPYINKINCFCYDARTLKSKEKGSYTLVMFIDPEVTKDSKTKNVNEITIQLFFMIIRNTRK